MDRSTQVRIRVTPRENRVLLKKIPLGGGARPAAGEVGGGRQSSSKSQKKMGRQPKKKNEIENGCWEKEKKWQGSPDDLQRKGIPDGDTPKGTTQFNR
jgi:hypothetical protein